MRKLGECALEDTASIAKVPTRPTVQPRRQTSALEGCLTQYDILRRLASNLTSVDLFCLATTSKTAWTSIKNTDDSWKNLTNKALCDGYGVRYRTEVIRPALLRQLHDLTYDAPLQDCGAVSGNDIETNPCVRCQRAVCDECRIHAVYCAQLKYIPANSDTRDTDTDTDISGYLCAHAFLDSTLMVLSQSFEGKHTDLGSSCHDRGFPIRSVHIKASDFHTVGGLQPYFYVRGDLNDFISTGDWAYYGFSLTQELSDRHSGRLRKVCPCCVERYGLIVPESTSNSTFPCRCTLRSRFLDRWLCIPCYTEETGQDRAPHDDRCGSCGWDSVYDDYAPCVVCALCLGLSEYND